MLRCAYCRREIEASDDAGFVRVDRDVRGRLHARYLCRVCTRNDVTLDDVVER